MHERLARGVAREAGQRLEGRRRGHVEVRALAALGHPRRTNTPVRWWTASTLSRRRPARARGRHRAASRRCPRRVVADAGHLPLAREQPGTSARRARRRRGRTASTSAWTPCMSRSCSASSRSRCSRRATSTTLWPRPASWRASSAPMPAEAPVITTVCSGVGGGRAMTGNEYPRMRVWSHHRWQFPLPAAQVPARQVRAARGTGRRGRARRARRRARARPCCGTTSPQCTTAACSRGSARAASPRARRAGSGCRGRRRSSSAGGARSAAIEAAFTALETGVAMNLGGGTHHAGRDFGRGYCLFNDVAVALALLRREDEARAALIVDCDVHQGDGTAHIFADDPRTFTLSLHGARNYPFQRSLRPRRRHRLGHRRRRYLQRARRGARLRAGALRPYFAFYLPAPTPGRATGSGGSRSPRTAAAARRARPRPASRGGHRRLRRARRRIRRRHPRHRRHQRRDRRRSGRPGPVSSQAERRASTLLKARLPQRFSARRVQAHSCGRAARPSTRNSRHPSLPRRRRHEAIGAGVAAPLWPARAPGAWC